jgi:hypothetical protein
VSLTIPAVCDTILSAATKRTLGLEMPLPCPCPIQHHETTGARPPCQLRSCAGLWDTVDVFERATPRLPFSVPFAVSKPASHSICNVDVTAAPSFNLHGAIAWQERQEEAELENQLKTLQRKLEEAEL